MRLIFTITIISFLFMLGGSNYDLGTRCGYGVCPSVGKSCVDSSDCPGTNCVCTKKSGEDKGTCAKSNYFR